MFLSNRYVVDNHTQQGIPWLTYRANIEVIAVRLVLHSVGHIYTEVKCKWGAHAKQRVALAIRSISLVFVVVKNPLLQDTGTADIQITTAYITQVSSSYADCHCKNSWWGLQIHS